MIKLMIELYRARQARLAAERHEEMRRLTDDFGCGSLLRYGEDQWGDKSNSR